MSDASSPRAVRDFHRVCPAGRAGTIGGRGGRILRVSNLHESGPGSLHAAVEAEGARIVVFEVGGVIDLQGRRIEIKNPHVTIAGQTAPHPGITLIKGEATVATWQVIVHHMMFRPGEYRRPKRSGGDQDGLSTQGAARQVIVDHCSFSWATDENLSVGGPRFEGDSPEQWRRHTSRAITYSHNLIYNPGGKAVHCNLVAHEWVGRPHQTGRLALVGNVYRQGPDTRPATPLFALGGHGDVELFMQDNLAVDEQGRPVAQTGTYTAGTARMLPAAQPYLPRDIRVRAAARLEAELPLAVGARPWARDPIDFRLLSDVAEGRGRIIDSELQNAHGHPRYAATRRRFDASHWRLDHMSPKADWDSLFASTSASSSQAQPRSGNPP